MTAYTCTCMYCVLVRHCDIWILYEHKNRGTILSM